MREPMRRRLPGPRCALGGVRSQMLQSGCRTNLGRVLAVVAIAILPGAVSAQWAPEPAAFSDHDLLVEDPAASTAWLEDYAEPLADVDEPSPLTDAAARQERIAAHHPGPASSPLAFAPPNLLARLNLHWGAVLEGLSFYSAARDAVAHAIGLHDESSAAWRRLARLRIRTGEFEAAEGALLAAIEAAGPETAAERVARLHNELGELYLLLESPREAVASLQMGATLAAHSSREELLLGRAEYELDPSARSMPLSVVPLWPMPTPPAWKTLLLERGTPLVEAAHPRLRKAISRLAPHLNAETLLVTLGLLLLTVGLVTWLQRTRSSGDLLVSLHFPSELRGGFSVRISKKRGHFKRSENPNADEGVAGTRRRSTRSARHRVGREAHFGGLRSGEWFVTIEGVLRDEDSRELVASLFEERSAFVIPRQSQSLDFDLQAVGCRVKVFIVWEKRPARDATIGVDGLRDSLRYVRGGEAQLRLSHGKHRIAVGSNDRVVEAEIEIDGYAARELRVDLAGRDSVVFKGCPPAVEPYMHGDVEAAAQALGREGQRHVAEAMLARLRKLQGNPLKAAEHFEAAGLLREAAELQESLSNHERAAQLFLDAGETTRAAELFSAAGLWSQAGAAYGRGGDHANAAACYGEAGDHSSWASALERNGEAFDAARIALGAGDRARAIQLFQRVPQTDARFIESCRQLADCYEQEGHRDLAVHKLQEAVEASAGGEETPSLRWQLANLLEETGEVERALSVLDELRTSHPTYPNVATRIETLRKRQSAPELPSAGSLAETSIGGDSMTPTAFLIDQRYEVQDEIGRGGMGIVYRAHDRRLNRTVALKQLPQSVREHPRAIELFLREAQSAARLNHLNVVTVYDTDQQDGAYFITMELLQGYPLNAILEKKGKLKLRDALRIGVQVCAGLEYAHQQRIVHRDIKTANLFFTRDRVVKIMDFGLAKMLEEVRRASTIVGGTPYYMAPEQATGGDIDHRADLYALGVTMFQLVTGKLPFSDGDVTYQHRHVQPPDPRTHEPDLPEEFATLILQMLAKSPDDRPSSAAEVGTRLDEILQRSG